nr:SDR family NAD(P)-dependent oxidoreductase [Candidatus Chloroploca sp. Khr17]
MVGHRGGRWDRQFSRSPPAILIIVDHFPQDGEAAQGRIDQTRYTQPALFALEYALAQLWRSWGVEPDLLIGHSVGELTAACVAGVFSLEDGLRLIAARGRLMDALPRDGAMVALMTDETTVREALAPYAAHAAVAAVNGPQSVVISGRAEVLRAVAAQLGAVGVKARRLTVSHAFHSPLMDPILEAFHAVAAGISYQSPTIPLISNVTGRLAGDDVRTPAYWVRHVREAVRFADGVATLHEQGVEIFLEVGPHPTLLGMADQHSGSQVALLPSLWNGQSDWQQLMTSLGEMYARGVPINWEALDADYRRRTVLLPTYPFQRQSYWKKPVPPRAPALAPLIDSMIRLPLHDEVVCATDLSLEALPYLAEHRVFGTVVAPGACQLAVALSAARLVLGREHGIHLRELVFPRALVLPAGGRRTVQTVLQAGRSNGHGPHDDLTLISFDPDSPISEPRTHATGMLVREAVMTPSPVDLAALRERCRRPGAIDTLYARSAAAQIELGSSFRWIVELWHGSSDGAAEVLARLVAPEASISTTDHLIHPGLLDACFQVATMARSGEAGGKTLLPFAVEALCLHHPARGASWWCHAAQVGANTWDIRLLDAQGESLAEIEGFEMRSATSEAVHGAEAWRSWLYQVAWLHTPARGGAPDYLPTPATLAQELQATLPQHWAAYNGDRHANCIAALEELSAAYVLLAFVNAGFTFQPGARWRSEQIARQIGVIPSYHRLLERMLAILAEQGTLRQEPDGWSVVRMPPPVSPALQAAQIQSTYGDSPELLLLMRCGERLSEVLHGAQEPLELLFPGGDSGLVSRLYAESPFHQVMNSLIQDVAHQVVARLPEERVLRVLEIGAGTGSTTAVVLPCLPANRTEYTFTDIGASFLSHAQARFEAYPFIHYQPLDIEQDPEAQGFRRRQADVVLAANVLHATRDVSATLTHVRRLLQPGGQLILLEVTSRSRWADLTFGLTEGWWRFTDQRQQHPLLSAEQWSELLQAHGFLHVEIVERSGYGVIIAQVAATPDARVAIGPARTWLLFADTNGIGEALAARLRQAGDLPVLISAGETYQEHAQRIQIRPDCAADYQRVLTAFPAAYGVIHMWSLDTPILQEGADLVGAAKQSCGTLLHLTQALLQTREKPAGFWCVTREAQAVVETDEVQGVVQASLWGMGRVIDQEYPELNGVRIDIGSGEDNDLLAAQLWSEIEALSTRAAHEKQVALRDGARYVARLSRFVPQASAELNCEPAATYLITGGLGGLGLATAAWLAERGARHLVLVGRSRPSVEAQAQVAALEARGLTVTVAQCDVTRRADLGQCIGQIDDRYPLRGVIHAVGVLDDGALLHQSWERFAAVLAPKVQGAWHLHELTRECRLDFFVLFSAAAGLLGNRGQANHAAANTFLDAFAAFRRAQGLPALVIDWGAWSDVGAAAELMRQSQAELVARGITAMTPSQGIAALAGVFGQAVAQVAVLPIRWQTFLQQEAVRQPFFAELLAEVSHAESTQAPQATPAAQTTLRQRLEAAPPAERAGHMTIWLQQVVARTLHLPEHPHPLTGFSELGMDSLMTIELRRHLEKELEVSLRSTLAFEYPTIELLGQYLLRDVLGVEEHLVERARAEQLDGDQGPTNLGDLSDDDLNMLLSQELAMLDEAQGAD